MQAAIDAAESDHADFAVVPPIVLRRDIDALKEFGCPGQRDAPIGNILRIPGRIEVNVVTETLPYNEFL